MWKKLSIFGGILGQENDYEFEGNYIKIVQKYMKTINVKEVVGLHLRSEKRKKKSKWVRDITLLLVSKVINAFINGSKCLVY